MITNKQFAPYAEIADQYYDQMQRTSLIGVTEHTYYKIFIDEFTKFILYFSKCINYTVLFKCHYVEMGDTIKLKFPYIQLGPYMIYKTFTEKEDWVLVMEHPIKQEYVKIFNSPNPFINISFLLLFLKDKEIHIEKNKPDVSPHFSNFPDKHLKNSPLTKI